MYPYHNFVTVESDCTVFRIFDKDDKGSFIITKYVIDKNDHLVSDEVLLSSTDFVIAREAFIQLIEDSL